MAEQEQGTERRTAELKALDGALHTAATDTQTVQSWWEARARRRPQRIAAFANTGDDVSLVEFGPGGLIDVVPLGAPDVAAAFAPAQSFRVVRKGSVTTPTAQLQRAREWLTGKGFPLDPDVPEDSDPDIGVTRLQLAPDVSSADLLRELRSLRYDGAPDDGPPLCIGPDDITMEGMHAKAATGADPLPVADWQRLGPRPRDDDRGAGVTVAVIDGGFERADKGRTDGWMDNVVPPPEDAPLDTDEDGKLDGGAGHGTFVTGVVLQVASAVTVRQYRALDSWGMGNTWRLKDCLLAAARDGAQIINLSLGFDDADLLGSPALSAALNWLPPDVLVVAAVGNSGSPVPSLPAAHSRCIGVGALKVDPDADTPEHLVPCSWSSFGPWVEFSCVGLGVLSTFVEEVADTGTDPQRLWAGTSFAAPQISGLLAVELGRGKTQAEAVAAVHEQAGAQTGPPHPDFGHLLRVL